MKRIFPVIALGLFFLLVAAGTSRATQCCLGDRGNIDNSQAEQPDIADLVYLVDYMFSGGPEAACPEEADVNGDDAQDIADLVYLVDFMFSGGPGPVECPPEVVVDVIQPLVIGNQWVTSVVEYNESGQQTDAYSATGEIVGDSVINDTTWYIMTSDTGAGSSVWTNKDDGAWLWTDSAGQPQALMMKYPASVGESYGVYMVTVTVDATTASVTVPAGTFECYYYRAHIPLYGTIGKVWACPNVGVVRAEEYGLTLFGTYLSRTVELLNYVLVTR